MATQDKHEVTIRGRFSPGTKVALVSAGAADVYNGAGNESDAVQTVKTNADGETTFKAPPGRYFAVATEKVWNVVLGEHRNQVRSVDVTINEPRAELEPHLVAGPEIGPEPPAPSFLGSGNVEIISGARGTHVLDPGTPTRVVDNVTGMVETFASPVVGEKTPAKELPPQGVNPAPRQEDHRGAELASSTLTGEAVAPISQPRQQSDVPKRTPQASDTELGTEAPAREVVRQEDVSPSTPLASNTETGEAVVIEQAPTEPPVSSSSKRGSASARKATKPVKGRSGSKTSAKKAAEHARKANKSRQVRAAKKAAGPTRSAPATDARGVEHREVPEDIGTPTESTTRKAARARKS
jgi:hypothetical protein